MSVNRLQLNASKTQYIWCAPARRHHHIPSHDVNVGLDFVHPVHTVYQAVSELDTLVISLVHSRLDYCNVVLAGLPARDFQRLQTVLNE